MSQIILIWITSERIAQKKTRKRDQEEAWNQTSLWAGRANIKYIYLWKGQCRTPGFLIEIISHRIKKNTLNLRDCWMLYRFSQQWKILSKSYQTFGRDVLFALQRSETQVKTQEIYAELHSFQCKQIQTLARCLSPKTKAGVVKRRIPSDSGGSRVCCLLLLFLELLPPHQLLVSVRTRLQRDAASNQSERTPAAPSTCSFRTVGSTRVDALWQPDRPSARHRQLGAREPSCDWCRPGRGPPSEAAGQRMAKPPLCLPSPQLLIFLNFPLLSLLEVIFSAGCQSHDHNIHSSQTKTEKKFDLLWIC